RGGGGLGGRDRFRKATGEKGEGGGGQPPRGGSARVDQPYLGACHISQCGRRYRNRNVSFQPSVSVGSYGCADPPREWRGIFLGRGVAGVPPPPPPGPFLRASLPRFAFPPPYPPAALGVPFLRDSLDVSGSPRTDLRG